jgi:hypothetical protein
MQDDFFFIITIISSTLLISSFGGTYEPGKLLVLNVE